MTFSPCSFFPGVISYYLFLFSFHIYSVQRKRLGKLLIPIIIKSLVSPDSMIKPWFTAPEAAVLSSWLSEHKDFAVIDSLTQDVFARARLKFVFDDGSFIASIATSMCYQR